MENELFDMHAELCKTISDPKRLKILYLIGNKEKSVSEIVKQSGFRQANVSQHLAILRQKGVVIGRRKGKSIEYSVAFPKMVKACNLIREVLDEQAEQKRKIFKGGRK